MANELAESKKTNAVAKVGMATYLSTPAIKSNIENVVGKNNVTTFIASIVSAVQTTPALAKCTHNSILNAALLGEALKLTPSPQLGQFYMVPYDNKKAGTTEAQFQLGYRGMIQLAIRSGQYRKIVATEVKDGEVSEYNPITEDYMLHPILDPAKRAKAKVVGYYAMFELVNGFRKEIYWTKEAMEEHATKYSKGYKADKKNNTDFTFWTKDFDEMAKKTLLRQIISKWGAMDVNMQKAYESDMGIIRDDGSVDYVDNVTDVREVAAEEISANANQVEFDFVDAEVKPAE